MTLTTEQQTLVEQRLSNEKKSTGVAYLVWFFLGSLGVHRFYLGRTGSGVAMLLLTVFGVMTVYFVIGAFLLIGVGIWLLVDAFLIPGMVAADSSAKRTAISAQVAQADTAS